MEQVKSGVYKLFWNNSDYFYIGQSVDLQKRYKKHLLLLRKQIHENKKLQNIYNKYGKPDFHVIEFCSLVLLDETEQKYLDIYFSDNNCCNICQVASSTKGYKHTPESLIKISKKSKEKVFTEEYREKLRNRKPNITMLGKKHSLESRKKMSESRKGVPKTKEHKEKIGMAHKGEKSYNFGKKLSESTKNKLSFSLSRGKNPRAKKIINLNNNKIYECIKDASIDLNINYSTLKSKLAKNKTFFLQYL